MKKNEGYEELSIGTVYTVYYFLMKMLLWFFHFAVCCSGVILVSLRFTDTTKNASTQFLKCIFKWIRNFRNTAEQGVTCCSEFIQFMPDCDNWFWLVNDGMPSIWYSLKFTVVHVNAVLQSASPYLSETGAALMCRITPLCPKSPIYPYLRGHY